MNIHLKHTPTIDIQTLTHINICTSTNTHTYTGTHIRNTRTERKRSTCTYDTHTIDMQTFCSKMPNSYTYAKLNSNLNKKTEQRNIQLQHTHNWHANFLKQETKLEYLCKSISNRKNRNNQKRTLKIHIQHTHKDTHNSRTNFLKQKATVNSHTYSKLITNNNKKTQQSKENAQQTHTIHGHTQHNWHTTFLEQEDKLEHLFESYFEKKTQKPKENNEHTPKTHTHNWHANFLKQKLNWRT